MKTQQLLFCFTSSITSILADIRSFQEIYSTYSEYVRNATGNKSPADFRAVTLQMQELQEYGCWCYFAELHGQGRGAPVDGYDKACMHYHHGVQCAAEDYTGCDPSSVSGYLVSSKPDPLSSHSLIYDCESNNSDGCLIATANLKNERETL